MAPRKSWKEMTEPVSLEEYAGEAPMPTPRPTLQTDDWVQLPQNPEKGEAGSGYFTYGRMPKAMPGTKADFQHGEPHTMRVIGAVVNSLAKGNEYTPVGIGNISLAGGRRSKDHRGHVNGLEIDLRPARNDGREGPNDGLTYRDAAYDRAATRRLIKAFQDTGQAEYILFNDPELIDDPELKGFVRRSTTDHDNHLHVRVKPGSD